jgi:hypothetical protein
MNPLPDGSEVAVSENSLLTRVMGKNLIEAPPTSLDFLALSRPSLVLDLLTMVLFRKNRRDVESVWVKLGL